MNRRSFLCALAGLAATLRASGRVGAGPFINASVAVAYDQPGRAISDNFIGLSYESAVLASPEQLSPGNLSIIGLLRGLGPGGVLRLGGNSSEHTVWRDTGDRPEVESFAITPAAIDALAVLLNALDWQLIYGLNLARAKPEAAAEEAAYVARAAGPRLLAFQIGNEPDGFGRWSSVRPQSYDFDAFLAEWRQYYTAIRARLPTAPFAGPDIIGEQKWIRPFIEAAGDALVLVTRHYYADGPAGAPHISLALLLRSAPKVEPILAEMRSISRSYRLPFRIAETNSIFMEGQQGVSDAFGSALWGVEFMFQVAEAGGEGVNFHTGDAKAYTPIGPGPDGRHVARPLYYGMLMFKEAVRGASMLPARLVAPGLNMAAYATRGADGTLKVCLINKDLERGARVGIEAGRDFPSASLLRLTAPSAEARTDVTFGGSAVDGFGHWSPQPLKVFPWRSDSFVEVPAASAVIVQLSPR
ncbi:MAG: glycosyl hydrolase family 79 C-terminal domain-containing protein [Methyloceanibacter sp.]